MSDIIETVLNEWRGHYSEVETVKVRETLKSVHTELLNIKNSGIQLKNYYANVEKLKRDAEYLQRWSSEKIILDKIPPSINLNYYLMDRTLYDYGMKDTETIYEMYKMLYEDVFGIELKVKPKKIEKTIRKLEEAIIIASQFTKKIPDFSQTEKGKEVEKSLREKMRKEKHDRCVETVLALPEVQKLIAQEKEK